MSQAHSPGKRAPESRSRTPRRAEEKRIIELELDQEEAEVLQVAVDYWLDAFAAPQESHVAFRDKLSAAVREAMES